MAKSKGTATPSKVQRQKEEAARLAGGSGGSDDGAGLFDADAYEQEIKAVRERHTAKLRDALNAATLAAELADAKVRDLQAQLDKIEGRESSGRRAAAGGGGQRMKREEKARYVADALAFIGSSKEGVSRSQIAERLGIEAGAAATVLKALAADGKVKKEGDKASTRYFAK